jgi:hypothetical protein
VSDEVEDILEYRRPFFFHRGLICDGRRLGLGRQFGT